MAAIDQTKTSTFELCWARGDDDPKTFTVKDAAGVAIDISTWTLSMAVNTLKDPPTAAPTEIFRVSGIFVTNGTDGQISFTPPASSLDSVTAPGTAFYDIQRIIPSKKTLVKGKVLFIMDIDKA